MSKIKKIAEEYQEGDGMSDEHTCGKPAVYRYTWPGRNEALICEKHAGGLRAIASAMGLYIQLIPVPADSGECAQKVAAP